MPEEVQPVEVAPVPPPVVEGDHEARIKALEAAVPAAKVIEPPPPPLGVPGIDALIAAYRDSKHPFVPAVDENKAPVKRTPDQIKAHADAEAALDKFVADLSEQNGPTHPLTEEARRRLNVAKRG